MAKEPRQTPFYQLHVALNRAEPQIWRRILVPSHLSLADLHTVLQVTMGWQNYHLHLFQVGDQEYGLPDPEWDMPLKDERRVKLSSVLSSPEVQIRYDYDLGDGWTHTISLEKIEVWSQDVWAPQCFDGQRACPPEDCGGVPGYHHLITVLRDKGDPEYQELR